MNDEYNGVEGVYLIREANADAAYYENAAVRCIPLILDGSRAAYAMMLHYAALVEVKQGFVKYLKNVDFIKKIETIHFSIPKRTR